MNVRKETITPPPPPPTKFTIELGQTEANYLFTILGYTISPTGWKKGPIARFGDDLYRALGDEGANIKGGGST